MVGWHHRLNGHEFEQTPGAGEGQGSLRAAVHGVAMDMTENVQGSGALVIQKTFLVWFLTYLHSGFKRERFLIL